MRFQAAAQVALAVAMMVGGPMSTAAQAAAPAAGATENPGAPTSALQAAAVAGDRQAQYELATQLLHRGVYRKAAGWFRIAAEKGDARAMNDLAAMLLDGLGVDARDPAQAQTLFARAGDAGYPGGHRMAAEIALSGAAGTADRELGLRLMRQAAQAGDALAQFRLSSLLGAAARRSQDMDEPVAWLRRAAQGGQAMAADQLGLLSVTGLGVPQDLAAARQWFEQAAAAGWVPAKVRLAQLLLQAPGSADIARARGLLEQAAAAGHIDARLQLFELIHAKGQPDDGQALAWLRAAAEEGHPRAAQVLGEAYRTGRGAPVDPALAQFWRARAAASGEPTTFQAAIAAGAAPAAPR